MLAFCPLLSSGAQQRPASFLAAPLSPSTVFHGSVVEDSSGAITLEFAVLVRGPESWWSARTAYDVGRADSLPEGVYAQGWRVGPWEYRLRLDAPTRRLELFGRSVSLAESNIVLVTLGETPQDSVVVRTGTPTRLVLQEGENLGRVLIEGSEELREFAGLSGRVAPRI